MNHAERYALAERIVEDRFARHGEDALAGGVYGSAARGEDTPWSDLEVLVLGTGALESGSDHLLVKGVPVSVRTLTVPDVERLLVEPTIRWPETLGVLDAVEVLRGDPSAIASLVERARATPPETLRSALRKLLPQLVFESWGRVHSSAIRGNRHDLHVSAVETTLDVVIGLCFLNGAWVEHDYFEGVRDAAAFDLVPPDFEERAEKLWLASDLDEAVAASDALVHGFLDLLQSEGIATREELFGTGLGLGG
jgi:predicted nucleotidyltransferase